MSPEYEFTGIVNMDAFNKYIQPKESMRRVKPLTGQVLIELLPTETETAGGIALPNRSLSPEEVQDSHHNPKKPPGLIGVVRACGAWPKLPCGKLLLPEYGLGAKVVIPHGCGTALAWDSTRRLRMIPQGQVLAVIS